MCLLPLLTLHIRTKIAIRMSRVSDKQRDSIAEESESSGSEETDDDDQSGDEREHVETPDLYRNSALGM